MSDQTEALRACVLRAVETRKPLRFHGGSSKDFYGGALCGEPLDTRDHNGVIDYEPSELVITARAGTPLAEIETVLAERGQMLACEPFDAPGATLGGVVAAGLSGPRRMAAGSVRDFVLGVRMIDGRGDVLSFGGRVIKNVAGYDISRLMAGSMGTLGLLLDISFKVVPRPPAECSLRFEMTAAEALEEANRWGGQPLPVSATCWCDGQLTIRLSGAGAAVAAARQHLGGEALDKDAAGVLWQSLQTRTHPFFAGDAPLYRLALPTTAASPAFEGDWLVEWGGGQRWLRSGQPLAELRAAAANLGGHVTGWRGGDRTAAVFQPQSPVALAVSRQLKQRFDPHGIFNPGRLTPDF